MVLAETVRTDCSSEICPQKHGQPISEKGTMASQGRKESFQQMVLEDGTSIYQKINPDIILTVYKKINSKWTINLNVIWKSRENLCDLGKEI